MRLTFRFCAKFLATSVLPLSVAGWVGVTSSLDFSTIRISDSSGAENSQARILFGRLGFAILGMSILLTGIGAILILTNHHAKFLEHWKILPLCVLVTSCVWLFFAESIM
jgi:hypothetical protein